MNTPYLPSLSVRRLVRPLLLPVLAAACAASAGAMTEQERRDHLAWMQKNLPNTPTFNAWVERTKEIPPDYDAFPRNNFLPEPLQFLNGRPVRTAAEWTARRNEIKQLFEKYDIGTMPARGKIHKTTVTSETPGKGYFTRVVQLEYGPDPAAPLTLDVTVTVPEGAGPFPVLMGGNAASLLRRGYIAATYNQSVDIPNEVPLGLQKQYPDYDFYSMGQKAWVTSLVVDYLHTMPQVDKARIAVTGYSRTGKMATFAAAWDERIAAVIAGSTGVGGVTPWRLSGEYGMGEGAESTTRSFPVWFHPRLRFFSGKEDRLPVEANLLAALIAPRSILIQYGLNDEVANTWANEQVYYSAGKVFSLLKKPDAIGLLRVPGFHGANDVEAYLDWLDIQFGRSTAKWDNKLLFSWNRADWLKNTGEKVDLRSYPSRANENLLAKAGGGTIATPADWEKSAADIRASIHWMLGTPPIAYTAPARGGGPGRGAVGAGRGAAGAGRGAAAGGAPAGGAAAGATAAAEPALGGAAPAGGAPAAGAPAPAAGAGRGAAVAGRGAAPAGAGRGAAAGPNPGQLRPDVPAWVISRSSPNPNAFGWSGTGRALAAQRNITFSHGVTGTIYYPSNTPAGTRLPVAIWLHGYSYPLGYMWVYRTDLHPILALVEQGYAVLAYDQAGFGSRMPEFATFYDRQPKWSLMGQMVTDVQRAIDVLSADAALDPERISVYGYSVGGMVGLYAAALDPRIKGVVSISGFTPMRTDTADRGLGGLARYSDERALIPRLGFFIGQESRVPYDFDGVIAAIAPRPVLVVEPTMDRATTPADVRQAVTKARAVYALYGAADQLAIQEPVDYTRLTNATQDAALKWLNASQKPNPVPYVAPAPAAPAP